MGNSHQEQQQLCHCHGAPPKFSKILTILRGTLQLAENMDLCQCESDFKSTEVAVIMNIEQISPDSAEALCRRLNAELPEYFDLPEADEYYAVGVRTRTNFAVQLGDTHIALLSLDFPYPNNSNIFWMAVSRQYHGKGIGNLLVQEACVYAKTRGARTMTLETLSPSEADANYLKTYKFYESCGFEPLFNLIPKDCDWTAVYMMKSLG
jgi:ribosomal protein S18 acetylase RimI-like enzyme